MRIQQQTKQPTKIIVVSVLKNQLETKKNQNSSIIPGTCTKTFVTVMLFDLYQLHCNRVATCKLPAISALLYEVKLACWLLSDVSMSTGMTCDAKPDCLGRNRDHAWVTTVVLSCFLRIQKHHSGSCATFLNEVSSLTLTNPSLLRRTCLSRKASCSRFSSDR